MVTELGRLPLVVIVGPTASGKTAVAIELAKLHGGEVIAADSRTVYREMDIGTAKPSLAQRDGIVHWGFDLTQPGERFTAAEFQRYTVSKIHEIRQRGHLPIIAGGTGLYTDGVIFDYKFPEPPTAKMRQKLEAMEVDELYKYCIDNNIQLPINDKNKRHLVRSIVHHDVLPQRRSQIIDNTLVVGISTEKEILEHRFIARAEQMFDNGVVEEAIYLGKKYGWDSEAMSGNIYPLIADYLAGKVSLNDTKSAFVVRDRQLAKRQMTWFRRNPWIVWAKSQDVIKYITQVLDTRTQI